MGEIEDRRQVGEDIQRELFGEYPPAVRGPAIDRISADWAAFADETVFGFGWARGVLTRRQRSLVTVAGLAAQGLEPQLRQHIRGALNIGWEPEELVEAIMQLVFYAGWPKAQNALQVLVEVLEDRGYFASATS